MKDDLGNRIKNNYENVTRFHLPKRTYTIIRVDGRAFSTFTKGFKRPEDSELVRTMNDVAHYLFDNLTGAKLAYVQSDEISILLTDFDELNTQPMFDNNLQKLCSISSSMATGRFIMGMTNHVSLNNIPQFDSRVFTIPSRSEVANYFLWRFKDCRRNAILNCANVQYGHKFCHGKNTKELLDLLTNDTKWNSVSDRYKYGYLITKDDAFSIPLNYEKIVEFVPKND